MESTTIGLLRDVGFPIFVALILLYDKLKSNNNLMKVVENNNAILHRVEKKLAK